MFSDHESREINTYQSFYFQSNRLTYASIELKTADDLQNSLFKTEEFYKNDKVIFKRHTRKPKRYIDLSSYSLFEDGQKFLAAFKKENNRR